MNSPPDSSQYGPLLAELLDWERMPELGPGRPVDNMRPRLERLGASSDFVRPMRNPTAARACLAGLWLLYDFLDESHTISQDLSTAEGSFWHAIMHRREPDAWNSKYWWRRVGPHPVLARLRAEAPGLGYTYKSPEEFVDFCERVRGTGKPDEEIARKVQRLEWQFLFDHCHLLATRD